MIPFHAPACWDWRTLCPWRAWETGAFLTCPCCVQVRLLGISIPGLPGFGFASWNCEAQNVKTIEFDDRHSPHVFATVWPRKFPKWKLPLTARMCKVSGSFWRFSYQRCVPQALVKSQQEWFDSGLTCFVHLSPLQVLLVVGLVVHMTTSKTSLVLLWTSIAEAEHSRWPESGARTKPQQHQVTCSSWQDAFHCSALETCRKLGVDKNNNKKPRCSLAYLFFCSYSSLRRTPKLCLSILMRVWNSS